MTRLALLIERIAERYDAVVVGSGYGASVAACRLAASGKRVCVLERGREIRPGEYPNDTGSMVKEVQLDLAAGRMGSGTALFDLRVFDDLNVAMGCGLGGTSLESLRSVGRVEERTPGAVLRASRAFRADLAPSCTLMF